MNKEKGNEEILAGIKSIRKGQILTSFDVVFMVLVPIASFIAGYIATHPEVQIRFDPQFIYYIFVSTLVVPLFFEIFGILNESIEYRLCGWWLFFVFGIFSYLSYSMFSQYRGIAVITSGWQFKIYFFFGLGDLLVGLGGGDLFFSKIFLRRLFLPRMSEVGVTKVKMREFPDLINYTFVILGFVLIIIGRLLLPPP